MATYLDRPNLQSYQFRPYELPVEQIARSIASRSNQWEVAASQVKDAYEAASGLSLSRRESKEKLQEFMTKADDLMRKAARSELSIGENQRKAMKIFDPLYQDQTIMLDHANTTFYQQEFRKAENAKTRDGGKEYSQDNFNYLQEKYQDFLNDPNYDVSSLQKHFNEKRGYTPYYNYNPEIDNVLKNCKPNSFASTGIKTDGSGQPTLYFDVKSDKSLSSAKLAGCLSTGLSSRAKTQLGIEGYMAYGKNYQGLATDYLRHTDNELNAYRTEKGAMDGRAQGLRDKKNLTENERLELAQLEQTSNQLGEYITDQLKERDVIAGGNLDFVRENYERLAAPLYLNRKVNQYAQYYQFSDISQKLEENNAAMLEYKAQRDVENMATKFQQQQSLDAQGFVYDYRLQELRNQGQLEVQQLKDLAGGKLGVQRVMGPDGQWRLLPQYPNLDPAATPQNLVEQGEATVNSRYKEAVDLKTRADDFLFQNFKTKFPEYQDAKSLIASEKFQNYMNTNPEDINIGAWLQAAKKAGATMTRIEALKMDVDSALRQQNPELYDNSNIGGKQGLAMPDGTVMSPQRIADAIRGIDPDLRVTTAAGDPGDLNNPFSAYANNRTILEYKGRPVVVENTPAMKVITDVRKQLGDKATQLSEKRNKLFANKIFEIDGRKDIGGDNIQKDNTFKNRVAATLGVDPEQVILNSANLTGDVWVTVQDNAKKPLPGNVLESLRKSYKVDKEGDSFRFSNVPEYRFFEGNDYYKDALIDISASMKVNMGKINRNIPLEIPISSVNDAKNGSNTSMYKLVIRKGPEGLLYQLHRRNAQGEYVPSQQRISNELEALKVVQELDKYAR